MKDANQCSVQTDSTPTEKKVAASHWGRPRWLRVAQHAPGRGYRRRQRKGADARREATWAMGQRTVYLYVVDSGEGKLLLT